MTYGRYPYGGVAYAGSDVAEIPQADTKTTLAVEVAFTTDALAEPVWVDIAGDVRSWDVQRGRNRELERMQPGRATVVLGNRERQYDSVNAAGPWFGNIKPMRRVRIRETFNGVTYPVFDGYADKWQLDYPGKNKDATATVVATDAFKIWARTDLPSVYALEVENDNPSIWWHLDEGIDRLEEGTVLDSGSLGVAATFVADPKLGDQTLIVHDAGSAMSGISLAADRPAVQKQGFTLTDAQFDLLSNMSFSVECWTRMDLGGNALGIVWMVGETASDTAHAICGYVDDTGTGATGRFQFIVVASGGATFYAVETPDGSVLPGQIHHVVCVVEADEQMAIYLDGTRYTDLPAGFTGTDLSGVTRIADGDIHVGYDCRPSNTAANNWHGTTDELAIYVGDLGSARIGVHNAAGRTPWTGDLPGVRMGRILDEVEWPATLRELDAGITTFQSAELATAASEHLQKASESEYASLFFVSRDGKARFVGRTAVFARDPGPAVYGDLAGEVGYTDFVPDDGDEVIRNRATISRLNGVAKKAEDVAAVDEFGRFDYTLEGLLQNTDSESQNHANFVVSEYADPRRRIASLSLGPPIAGDEDIHYPAVLGPELGDAITVRSRPSGGGALFEQVCAIERIRAQGVPGGVRQTTFTLSPEFAVRALEDEDVATLGYAQVTANQAGITTLTDLTGLSTAATVGTNRYVRITAQILTQRTVADGETNLYIREGSTTLEIMAIRQNNVGVNETLAGSIVIDSPSAGSHTYKLSLERGGGTGTVQATAAATFPAFILVEDIGPS